MAAGGPSTAAPKQFLAVGGVPVLIRSVRAFLAVPRVDAVCVAVRAHERERMEADLSRLHARLSALPARVGASISTWPGPQSRR